MTKRNDPLESFDVKPFNAKLRSSILTPGWLRVWEGAVRSGKTQASLFAWILYVSQSKERVFAMSGYTKGSLSRNCLTNKGGLFDLIGKQKLKQDSTQSVYFEWLGRIVYIFGSNNKRSFESLRGMTLGGVYSDEANLQNKEFLGETFKRTIASNDRQHFWTMNPDTPNHWIYTEYMDKFQKDKMPGYIYTHCTIDDNPILTPERIAEVSREFSGVHYRRYILGERVRAEGSIYKELDKSRHRISRDNVLELIANRTSSDQTKPRIAYATIGIDVGMTTSATAMVLTGTMIRSGSASLVVIAERYLKETPSNKAIEDTFREFVAYGRKVGVPIREVRVDSASALTIKDLRATGIATIKGSKKNPILDRIRMTKGMLGSDRLLISEDCPHVWEALEQAVWDDKDPTKEARLDDGTTNIDSLDAFEYSWEWDILRYRR